MLRHYSCVWLQFLLNFECCFAAIKCRTHDPFLVSINVLFMAKYAVFLSVYFVSIFCNLDRLLLLQSYYCMTKEASKLIWEQRRNCACCCCLCRHRRRCFCRRHCFGFEIFLAIWQRTPNTWIILSLTFIKPLLISLSLFILFSVMNFLRLAIEIEYWFKWFSETAAAFRSFFSAFFWDFELYAIIYIHIYLITTARGTRTKY